MDPDKTLIDLLALLMSKPAPIKEGVQEHLESLETWNGVAGDPHHKRGFLPKWPGHLDSGRDFFCMYVSDCDGYTTEAELSALLARSECIALLTRVQVGLETENRALYATAIRRLKSWAGRTLVSTVDPEIQADADGLEPEVLTDVDEDGLEPEVQ